MKDLHVGCANPLDPDWAYFLAAYRELCEHFNELVDSVPKQINDSIGDFNGRLEAQDRIIADMRNELTNFIDTLDVTAAVNAKLDQMVQQGVFDDLITALVEPDIWRPNLLDNWDLWHAINQRGVSSASAGQFIADRWLITAGGASISGEGIALNAGAVMVQRVPISRMIAGSKYIFSVLADGRIDSGVFTAPSYNGSVDIAATGNYKMVVKRTDDYYELQYSPKARRTYLGRAKLEVDNSFHKATLLGDGSQNNAEMLQRCRYYFEHIPAQHCYGNPGVGFSGKKFFKTTLEYAPKRTTPSVTPAATSEFILIAENTEGGGWTTYALNTLTIDKVSDRNCVLSCKTNSQFPWELYLYLGNNGSGVFDIDAEYK